MLKIVITSLMLAAGQEGSASPQTSPAAPVWELVGQAGAIKTVYVPPDRITDKQVLAAAVTELMATFGRARPVEINFFDAREATPKTLPFTDAARRRLRAKYNWIPKLAQHRFVWVEPAPADPNHPDRLRLAQTPDTLPISESPPPAQ